MPFPPDPHAPIDAIFRLHARQRPTKIALIDGDRRIDFATIDRLIDGTAHALAARGIAREQLIGVALRDHAEHLITLLALARLGAVILPMDWRWQTDEKLSAATHFAADRVLLDTDDPAAAAHGWDSIGQSWIAEGATPYHDPLVTDASPLLLSLSSGTTGMPKGPRSTHRMFESRFMPYWINLCMTAHDIYVSVTPLYFGGGRAFTLSMLFAGATVSLLSPRTKMAELAAHVAAIGGTVLFLVPTQLRRAIEEDLPALAFPSLRVLISSGSALHAAERIAIQQRLTPNLFEIYSSTEGGAVSVLSPADCALHPDSVGRPAFRVDVQIVDDAHTPLPPGEIGRLRYRSPASATAYYRAEGGEAFRDGWFYPGDLARLDAEGFLFLAGRVKDMMIRGGINIYPQDIERVIREIAGVRDVAIAGVAHATLGEEIAAFVVADGITAETIANACRAHLAPYKVPSIIRFLPEIPRNAAGKVQKSALPVA